jgi:hypothetical protein
VTTACAPEPIYAIRGSVALKRSGPHDLDTRPGRAYTYVVTEPVLESD